MSIEQNAGKNVPKSETKKRTRKVYQSQKSTFDAIREIEQKAAKSTWNEVEEFPGLSVREGIEKAIAERRKKEAEGGSVWYWYLNNFLCHLPGGNYRTYDEEYKRMDIPHGEYNKQQGWETESHSPLYLQQTPAEFYTTLDGLAAKYGISSEEISELQQRSRESSYSVADPNNPVRQLYERMLPVYIELREMGYTRRELIS